MPNERRSSIIKRNNVSIDDKPAKIDVETDFKDRLKVKNEGKTKVKKANQDDAVKRAIEVLEQNKEANDAKMKDTIMSAVKDRESKEEIAKKVLKGIVNGNKVDINEIIKSVKKEDGR